MSNSTPFITPASDLVVVAIGGNAIIKKDQKGTITEQFANTREILKPVVEMITQGYRIVFTHGNGPQVGHALIRVEGGLDKVPEIPLGVIVAAIEGDMGYMISQSLMNMLQLANVRKPVAPILTQVLVDYNDPRTHRPAKPVGSFYTREDAELLKKQKGWNIIEDSNRGYRRVVPSPVPLEIVEKNIIKILIENGVIVIAAGGGGIPVYQMENGALEGIDGVIDKDLTACILARDVSANTLMIVMDNPNVAINYGKPNEELLTHTKVTEMEKYMEEGHFPEGSMGPKIAAAINFLNEGGDRVIISSADNILESLEGKAGTIIIQDKKHPKPKSNWYQEQLWKLFRGRSRKKE